MEDKKSFVLYADLLHTVEKLSFDQAGKLFHHLLKYVNDLDPEPEDQLTEIVFEPIKQQLKRDLNKWKAEKEDRSFNGRMGNLKRWNPDLHEQVTNNQIDINEAEKIAYDRRLSPPDPTRSPTIANVAVSVNDNVSVNVNDSVNDNVKEIEIMDSPNLKDLYSQVYRSNMDIELVFDGVIKMRCSEYEKLLKSYTLKDIQKKMTSLSTGIHNKEKKYLKYKDHYRTILNWLQKDCQKKSLNGFSKKLI